MTDEVQSAKINYEKYVRLTEKEFQALEEKIGFRQAENRIKRLNELKLKGKRPLEMTSDFQALIAMGPRTVEPIREKEVLEKIKSILSASSSRDHFLLILGLNTGLRLGDMLPLKVQDVKGKKFIKIVEKSTGKIKRFPLNKELREQITEYTLGMEDNDYLFASRKTKKPVQRDRAYKIIKRAAEEAGVEFVGTHTMRKTFGYHFYQKYKDVNFLQTLFNHSSQSVTLRYIGVSQEEIDETIDDFSL
jgi:integrase